MSWKKIGKHEFNVEAIKDMSESQFKKTYSKKLGDKCSKIYYEITGKKKPKKKKED
tara:strand:- start:106 stop:273 length:168 start_codon:yes stop_codon:yes gene_type:complete